MNESTVAALRAVGNDHKRAQQSQHNTQRPGFKAAVGHEIPLASAKKQTKLMRVCLMDGTVMNGVKVQGFDKYTITFEQEDGRPITYFKHAIESFCEA